jgi:hypothetical protein
MDGRGRCEIVHVLSRPSRAGAQHCDVAERYNYLPIAFTSDCLMVAIFQTQTIAKAANLFIVQ